MPADIVHRSSYRDSTAEVWRALTTSEAMAAWLMDNDFREATAGHRFEFRAKPMVFWNGLCPCEVLVAEPERQLVLRWNTSMEKPSQVAFTLAPTSDGGATLELRHSGLQGVMGWLMKRGMHKGWQRMVERSIPYVVSAMKCGRVPPRDEVKRECTQARR